MKRTYYKTRITNSLPVCAVILAAGLFLAGISCDRPEPVERIYAADEEGVTGPEVLYAPKPSYTEEARIARAEGVVALNAVIRKNGSVDSFKVVRGLGYGLDESAIHTVATQWRFKPATYSRQPVDCYADIEIAFRIY